VQTDEQLARRLQQGDTHALAQLVERHHSPLLGFLYRLTGGDRALAEDLAQDTLLRVAHHSAAVSRAPVQAVAVRHRPQHRAITSSAPIRAHTDSATDAVLDDLAAPHDDELDFDAQQAAAITALPEHQRRHPLALLSRFIVAEIADTLNIPIGTVKSRLSRACSACVRGWSDRS
jgi:RNA polymerase sigma-70 factor (ECF subfamily)